MRKPKMKTNSSRISLSPNGYFSFIRHHCWGRQRQHHSPPYSCSLNFKRLIRTRTRGRVISSTCSGCIFKLKRNGWNEDVRVVGVKMTKAKPYFGALKALSHRVELMMVRKVWIAIAKLVEWNERRRDGDGKATLVAGTWEVKLQEVDGWWLAEEVWECIRLELTAWNLSRKRIWTPSHNIFVGIKPPSSATWLGSKVPGAGRDI